MFRFLFPEPEPEPDQWTGVYWKRSHYASALPFWHLPTQQPAAHLLCRRTKSRGLGVSEKRKKLTDKLTKARCILVRIGFGFGFRGPSAGDQKDEAEV